MLKIILTLLLLLPVTQTTVAETTDTWKHAISVFDAPLYPDSFNHFHFVNPDAPKQGKVEFAIHGSFDSLNPYILKGTSPGRAPFVYRYGFIELNEPLMVGTGAYFPGFEELGTAYGLIAESASLSTDGRTLSFKLRPEARFHDDHAVTSEDVAFSYRILLEKGQPQYRPLLQQVEKVEIINRHEISFHLKENTTRTLLIRLTELPVLPAHYWKDRQFDRTTLEPPLLSGPYRITKVTAGRSLTLERVKNYWGRDLPVNKGLYNFDKVTLNFFRDRHVAFQAFRSGQTDAFIEAEAKNWSTGYDFPAVLRGDVKRLEAPHSMPTGRRYFAYNLRRPLFSDQRVRAAISQLFDWEWTGRVLFHNAYVRSTSYFPEPFDDEQNRLSAAGTPSAEEKKLLEPFRQLLPQGILEQPFSLSRTTGDGNINPQRRHALMLLKQAGWHYQDGKLLDARDRQFHFEFLHYSKVIDRFILPFSRNLASVGIRMDFRPIDLSQYQRRLKQHDFDMIQTVIPMQFLPDERLRNYFHSSTAGDTGSQNLMGISNAAVDNMIERALSAQSRAEMNNAIRALDRILLWEHYAIPNWHGNTVRVAYRKHLHHPDQLPPFGFRLSSWWYDNSAQESDRDKAGRITNAPEN